MAAALEGVSALTQTLTRCDATGIVDADALRAALQRASIDGDSLLTATGHGAAPRVLASLARAGRGSRLHASAMALDPDMLILSAEDGSGPLDQLLAADRDKQSFAAAQLRERLATATSALSVAAARLDLQIRFVEAILDEDGATDAFPGPVRDLDAASARQAALAVGAMLAGRPLTIASGNRRALDALFASMESGGERR